MAWKIAALIFILIECNLTAGRYISIHPLEASDHDCPLFIPVSLVLPRYSLFYNGIEFIDLNVSLRRHRSIPTRRRRRRKTAKGKWHSTNWHSLWELPFSTFQRCFSAWSTMLSELVLWSWSACKRRRFDPRSSIHQDLFLVCSIWLVGFHCGSSDLVRETEDADFRYVSSFGLGYDWLLHVHTIFLALAGICTLLASFAIAAHFQKIRGLISQVLTMRWEIRMMNAFSRTFISGAQLSGSIWYGIFQVRLDWLLDPSTMVDCLGTHRQRSDLSTAFGSDLGVLVGGDVD